MRHLVPNGACRHELAASYRTRRLARIARPPKPTKRANPKPGSDRESEPPHQATKAALRLVPRRCPHQIRKGQRELRCLQPRGLARCRRNLIVDDRHRRARKRAEVMMFSFGSVTRVVHRMRRRPHKRHCGARHRPESKTNQYYTGHAAGGARRKNLSELRRQGTR